MNPNNRHVMDFTNTQDFSEAIFYLAVQKFWHKNGGGLVRFVKLTEEQFGLLKSKKEGPPRKVEHDFGWATVV